MTTPEPPTELLSLEEAKAHLNKNGASNADNTELAGFIAAVTAIATDRVGHVVPLEVALEAHDGGAAEVTLRQWPLLEVTAVSEAYPGSSVTLLPYSVETASGYLLEPVYGSLSLAGRCFAPGHRNVLVSYTAGRTEVPPAIRLGALRLLEHLWKSSQNGSAAGRPQPGPSGAPAPGSWTAAYMLPNFVRDIWAGEMRPPVLG